MAEELSQTPAEAGQAPLLCVAAHTKAGVRKATNQDSCVAEVAATPVGPAALICVCDGVGGLAAGELASASVVRWLSTWFETSFAARLGEGPKGGGDVGPTLAWAEDEWRRGLGSVNDALHAHGLEIGSRLGTTCTAALFVGGRLLVGHVGDTRLYRFRAGATRIVTEDQTLAARESPQGGAVPGEGRDHPGSSVILQAIGTQNRLEPAFYHDAYQAGDRYLVCCDGLRNELLDDELSDALADSSDEAAMERALARLAALALDRGETDDITGVSLACLGSPVARQPSGATPAEPVATTLLPSLETPTTNLADVAPHGPGTGE